MKVIIALFLMLAPFTAYGQMLKCVSKDGKVEYAAQCPAGTTATQTGIRSSPGRPSASAESKPKSLAEQDADFKKRLTDKADTQAKQEKEAAEKAQRQRACEDARSYLTGLESGVRISRTDPKTGERVFLEDAARAQEITTARQSVQTNCK